MESRCIADPENNKDDNKVVKWLDLPHDLVSLITAKLIIKDQIRLSSVCRAWQLICNEVRRIHGLQQRLRRPLPLLLFPTEEEDDKYKGTTDQTCSLYSLEDNKLCDFRLPVPHRYLPGSCFGWLVTVTVVGASDEDAQVTLLNPYHNKEINLPPLTAFRLAPHHDGIWSHYFLMRAVVSADPSSNPNNCIVMAIYGQFGRLAFCRPGDKAWTTLSSEVINCMEDIIFYKDQFYAIKHNDGDLWACDLVNLKISKIASGPRTGDNKRLLADKRYLVESASTGELLQVLRQVDNKKYRRTESFDVFKFDLEGGECIRMHDHLQGCTLFVGDNSSFSLFALDYNNPLGCQPNSIYFTDDHHEEHYREARKGRERVQENSQLDMGVFHFKDGSIRSHYPNRCTKFVPAPIWIEIPQLCYEGHGHDIL